MVASTAATYTANSRVLVEILMSFVFRTVSVRASFAAVMGTSWGDVRGRNGRATSETLRVNWVVSKHAYYIWKGGLTAATTEPFRALAPVLADYDGEAELAQGISIFFSGLAARLFPPEAPTQP